MAPSDRTAVTPIGTTQVDLGSHQNRRGLVVAGIVLGIGQAGFFDGIVFHQLLQWHHMFSNVETDVTVAGLELNTIGDGLFHLFDWFMTLTGLFLLWRAIKHGAPLSTKTFVGALLLGGGLFNVVEGIIDHHILAIHHVKPGTNQLIYDISFLAIGGFLAVIGWSLQQTAQREETT